MTYHSELDSAWGEEEDAPLPPRVAELGGRVFEIEPLDSYWHLHEGRRSLRILWSRRVDGTETTARTSYVELSQAEIENEATEAGLKLAGSLILAGDGYFLDQVALRFAAATAR
jgi:hypothetical protein